MSNHLFILQPGYWIGEGRVTFTGSNDHLNFYTRWIVKKAANDIIVAHQEVEMPGITEGMVNTLLFSQITSRDFSINLSNDVMGTIYGRGIIDAKTIAWEYRSHEAFEGFEVYELKENGDYVVHAEYASTEQFRTLIDAIIWKQEKPLFFREEEEGGHSSPP